MYYVTFEILTVVVTKITVFWDKTTNTVSADISEIYLDLYCGRLYGLPSQKTKLRSTHTWRKLSPVHSVSQDISLEEIKIRHHINLRTFDAVWYRDWQRWKCVN